jgi:hypothetical protein
MSTTLPGADIRGYYQALDVVIPWWATADATVRCFANPDAHRREDRKASCSVNLIHGAWHCHGCGATGGAYDAATATGRTSRQAIELMVRFGLTEWRTDTRSRSAGKSVTARRLKPDRDAVADCASVLTVTERDVEVWHRALVASELLVRTLQRDRAWEISAIQNLQVGIHRARLTIPTRSATGELIGVLFYKPAPVASGTKIRAAAGSRRALTPPLSDEPRPDVMLVEGEPDMIAARSRSLPAIAIPGADGWRTEWSQLFAGRRVTVVADADRQGRLLASRVARDLSSRAETRVVDLAPDRNDGYDLSDWLVAHPGRIPAELS